MVHASDPFAFSDELAKLSDAGVVVESLRCVHVRNCAATCTRCADACLSDAISFRSHGGVQGPETNGGRGLAAEFVASPERCTGCNACVNACPTGALTVLSAHDAASCRAEGGPVHVGAGGVLPQRVPERRQWLWQGVTAGGTLPYDTPVSWGKFSINLDACQACRMCAAFCPTGALTRYDVQGERGLQHRPSKCVDCRLCADTCPVGAITVEPGIEPGKLRRGAVIRYPLPEPRWLPTGTNQIREKMKPLINTKTLA